MWCGKKKQKNLTSHLVYILIPAALRPQDEWLFGGWGGNRCFKHPIIIFLALIHNLYETPLLLSVSLQWIFFYKALILWLWWITCMCSWGTLTHILITVGAGGEPPQPDDMHVCGKHGSKLRGLFAFSSLLSCLVLQTFLVSPVVQTVAS